MPGGRCIPALFLIPPLLHAAGIERISVTDETLTIHPAPGTSGMLGIVAVEPYDSYQSARNWSPGGTGGEIDFNREGSALVTFNTPSGPFDPQLVNDLDLVDAAKVSHLALRVKVEGFTGVIPTRAFVFGGGTASAGFTITADGSWRIARLDLSSVTGDATWSGLRSLRIDFPDSVPVTGYENARIFVDWIAVTNKPDFSNPLTWGRWDRFWDLGYQPAAIIADASSPVTIDRFDGEVDRYYQKFLLLDGFSPVGNAHWVDDFTGLSYKTVTDHGFTPAGPGAGAGEIRDGVYRMSYTAGSPFDPQFVTPNQEINGARTRHLHARVRMSGYTGAATTLTAGMYSTASGVSLASASFSPDGQWQVLHFDMAADPDWGGNENVRLDIPNNSGASAADFLNATLEVDWIAASNDPGYDGSGGTGAEGIRYDFEIHRLETFIIPLKGRQGVDSYSPDDFAMLQTDVGKLNVTLNNLVHNTASPRVHWKTDGLAFGINPDSLNTRLSQIATMGGLGINTYCTMLNQGNATLANDPAWPFINIRSSDQSPNNLYAFNTGDAFGLRYTRAVMEYAAHRMAQPGVVPANHWIYGNEIDAHWFWHNLGLVSAAEFRDYFAVEFRQAALVLAKYHPGFRVLLSHTHHWLSQAGGANQGMPSKVLIDELNMKWKSEGNFAWEVASHPYPQNLFNPAFWNDNQATLDFNTTKITYNNYEVLPVYFQREDLLFNGRQRGISLTEQGFHAAANETGQAVQAAAYACHWHRFKRIPGIKADILHRHTDHPAELSFLPGLRTLTGEPKEILGIFAVADTEDWRASFDGCLSHLPFASWDDPASLPAWTVLDFRFDEPGFTHGWQALNNTSPLAASSPGHLSGGVSGSDPQIGNNRVFALARNAQRFVIRMKTDSGSRGEIFWGTAANNNYQSVRKFTWDTIADGEFHVYDIDTLDHPDWNNQLIRRFRIDPTNVSSGSFEIAFILTGPRGDFDEDGFSDQQEGIATMRDSDDDGTPDFADEDPVEPGVFDYGQWSASFGFAVPSDGGPAGDPDGDGINNFTEYAFALAPDDAASLNAIASPPDRATGTFTYTRRDPGLSRLTYQYQYSLTLDGTWTVFSPAGESIETSASLQAVTAALPAELLAHPSLFIRVLAR
jgi:hypothetical protein